MGMHTSIDAVHELCLELPGAALVLLGLFFILVLLATLSVQTIDRQLFSPVVCLYACRTLIVRACLVQY